MKKYWDKNQARMESYLERTVFKEYGGRWKSNGKSIGMVF